ncbi:DHA2 family efflux MFS transporter permease subunit [Paenibacillus physcomitrellae]|uniref:MFS transporter n=1 Tax=Paenibacillus physcomitrellae TaxID=1619311 RepID=A0ABQ1FWP4_9BACL|nr:DHA2 family efflux MFS transporter permease subunit [Paenibacillus physcomitrellae]GGA30971.1 MFS transporter [Paenibacillus physcomitrellae]
MKQAKGTKDSFIFIMIAIFLGNFIAMLNSGTVNVALPKIMNDLHSSINTAQWVVTGFMLAIGIIAPVTGYLGNKIGYKNLYVYALIGLTASSALCGLSWNMSSLIVFRFLQGFSSGLIQISTMTIIFQSVNKEKQSMATSLWTVSLMVAPAIGPTLGGILTHSLGWKALFFANVPFGIIAALFAYFFIPAREGAKDVSLDFMGLLTVVVGNVSLLMYFTKGADLGWLSVPALSLLFFGVVGIAAFIWRELTAKEPLLNIRVFKYAKFSWGMVINCLISVGLYSSVFLVPIFMEEAQGESSFTAGMIMLPGALLMIIVTLIGGKLQEKIDSFWLVLFGGCLLSLATWEFSRLSMNSSIVYITFWMVIRYIGIGLAASPAMSISMSVIPRENAGHASTISNWLRQAMAALAIAIFSSILAARTQTHLLALSGEKTGEALKRFALVYATNDTFLVGTFVTIMAIPLSLLLKQKKSKSSKENLATAERNL